ncbi:MAG: hypothetical protein PWR01_1120 [Clostridiales bacterium]|nr:hypothetical protein [Clostridiales bacterium]
MSMFSISRIFITPYFSFLTILCSLILYMIYRSDVPGKFPKEQKIAKWGGFVYLVIGVLSFIFSRFAG